MSDHGATPRKLGREDTAILIPVRLGGRRFPDKALETLWGEPLFLWAYRAAVVSNVARLVRVVTDSEAIASYCEFGGKEIDCWHFSREFPTGSDRLAAAVQVRAAYLQDTKIIINLQCDEPQVSPNDLALLAHAMWESKMVQVATLATPLTDDDRCYPNSVTVLVDRHDRALFFTRALMYPSQSSLHHVGVYAFRRGALEAFGRYPRGNLEQSESLEQLRLLEEGVPINVVRIEGQRKSVNSKEDLEWLQKQKSPATT